MKVEHLRREFSPEVIPLKDLSCEVRGGDVISVIGPSGTGKSTFLNLLNRLDQPTSGKIWFEGEDTTAPGYDLNRMRRRMGMVFQAFHLFSHLTLAENIMLGPTHLLGQSRQEAYDQALRLLHAVGLRDRALSYPSELSGGQQQRAAIARAMAMKPRMLLFDEPTSALDPTMVGEVLSVIRHLAKDGVTMLIVTHEMEFARNVCNRVFYMDEGGIFEEGPPSVIFDDPRREKTRLFVKNIRAFQWRASERGLNRISLVSDFGAFACRHLMAPELSRRTQLFLEEFLAQAARMEKNEPGDVLVRAEYTEKSGMISLRLSWLGDQFSPLDGGDEYSRILMRHICPDAREEREQERSLLTGTIR